MLEEAVSQSASSPTLWAVINSWLTPTVFFVLLQFVIATIYITSNLAINTNHKQQQHQQQQQNDDPQQQQQLPRSPLQRLKSINFNSYIHRSQEPHLEVHNPPHSHTREAEQQRIPRSPTILQKLMSINLHSYFPTTPDIHESEKKKHYPLDDDENHETEELQHLDSTTIVENEEEEEDKDKGEEAGPSFDDIYSQILKGQGRHFNRSHSDTTAASGQVPVKLPGKSASTKTALSHFTEEDIVAVENQGLASVREGKVTAAMDSGGDDGGVDAKADDFINKFKQQLKLQRLESVAR